MVRHTGPKVLIIIPAFNEARNLPRVVGDLRERCLSWDIVVVDDGSRDDTGDVASRLNTIVVRLPFNLGIGGAVQSGLKFGALHGYDVCVQVDGDGQHTAAATELLINALYESGDDVIVGSRFLSEGGFRSTFTRRLGIRVLQYVISRLTGQSVSDPTSGQRAFGRRAIALLANNYPQEYPEPEALYSLLRDGLRVKEIPVEMSPRQHGRSSIGRVDSILYMMKVLLAIFMHNSRPSACSEETST